MGGFLCGIELFWEIGKLIKLLWISNFHFLYIFLSSVLYDDQYLDPYRFFGAPFYFMMTNIWTLKDFLELHFAIVRLVGVRKRF